MQTADTPSQRLDKWLWAARLFKTRSLANHAVSGGKVHVDGQRAKPSRNVRPGSEIRVRKRNFEITVSVVALAKQRCSADEARLLYRETEESRQTRESERQAKPDAPAGVPRHAPRPTKRDRRKLGDLKRSF